MMSQNESEQAYNWIILGRQLTGKTSFLLALIVELQLKAFNEGKKKRVLIYNPDGKNDVFEKKSNIILAIQNTIPSFYQMPGSLRKIKPQQISKIGNEKDDLYTWYIVSEGDIKAFSDPCRVLKDYVIVYDDCNNIVTGNIAGKRFEGLLDNYAGNRIRGNDIIATYHSVKQVAPALWTYFQRAIVKQTDDAETNYNKISKAKQAIVQALKEVAAENRKVQNPDGDFAHRIIWMNEEYVFEQIDGELVTKIGNRFYRAVGKKIELI